MEPLMETDDAYQQLIQGIGKVGVKICYVCANRHYEWEEPGLNRLLLWKKKKLEVLEKFPLISRELVEILST